MLTDDQRAKFVRLTQSTIEAKFEFLKDKLAASSSDDPTFKLAERRYADAVDSLLRFHHKLVENGIAVSVDEQAEVLQQVATNLGLDYYGKHFKRYRDEIRKAKQRRVAQTMSPQNN
jgi:hypothetical protein